MVLRLIVSVPGYLDRNESFQFVPDPVTVTSPFQGVEELPLSNITLNIDDLSVRIGSEKTMFTTTSVFVKKEFATACSMADGPWVSLTQDKGFVGGRKEFPYMSNTASLSIAMDTVSDGPSAVSLMDIMMEFEATENLEISAPTMSKSSSETDPVSSAEGKVNLMSESAVVPAGIVSPGFRFLPTDATATW